MAELKHIVHQYEQRIDDYGKINVKLKDVLERRGITRYTLAKVTGVSYEVVDRYYKNDNIQKVDLDIISTFCYALDCGIGELFQYEPPQPKEETEK